MATIKSFTSLEQSKKLAEILKWKTADMTWVNIYDENHMLSDHRIELIPFRFYQGIGLPAWSLAALLSVIRETIGYTLYGVNNVYMSCDLGDKPWKLETEVYDNEVDACYEMIIKLYELNLL